MRKLMMLAAMLAMVLVAAAPAMAQTIEGDGDVVEFDIEANDNTFQNQEAENNSVQILAANTGGNDNNVLVYGDGNETATGSGDIEQDAYQESYQVIQQAQADDESLAFNYNDLFFDFFLWW